MIISIFVFFILCFIYNKFVLNSTCIFVLKNDVSKGEKLSYENIQKVIVRENFSEEELIYPYDSIAKYDLKQGQILNNDIISRDDIKLCNEKVIIPLTDGFDLVKKGDFVNIYITTKKENIDNTNIKYVGLTNKKNLGTTVKIINNKEILEVYKNNENKIYIMIEAEKNIAMLIENIKDISKFSLSIVERSD